MDGKFLEHVERLTEINILRNVASCWSYSENDTQTGQPNSRTLPLGDAYTRGGGTCLYALKLSIQLNLLYSLFCDLTWCW